MHVHSVLASYRRELRAALGDGVRLPEWTPDLALEVMDRHRIAAAVTSLSHPGTHLGDDKRARDLAQECNDEAAANAAEYPRLGAFATVPLPAVDFACEEAARALDVLKLDGVCLLASYQGTYLGHPDFDPLLEVLNERSAVVLVHPTVHPSTSSVALNVPNFLVEYPFDTTRAAVNLMFADALDRFPDIRFILAHAGGTLPHLAWRISAIASYQMSDPPAAERFLRDRHRTALVDRLGSVAPQTVTELIGRFYYDTALAPTANHLSALKSLTDTSHIVFGSDWPYAYENFVADEVAALDEQSVFSAAEMAQVDRENALSLFPRLAKAIEADA
ncbi:amidohydrolase family protein [Dactylosporangium sp. CA-092794]|uniref:amidohydrolase family protein n=1 Tax=Dactylosporangium sp. CA-092794 TaxID=3239929 RepID=UPI003D92A1C3